MKFLIYYHKFINNDKGYIGLTRHTMDSRLTEHLKGTGPFSKAIKEYGKGNLISVVLEDNIPDLETAKKREIYYIKKYETRIYENGYNITGGGDACVFSGKSYEDILGKDKSDEKKKKMSIKQKGKVLSEEHKAKLKENHSNVAFENNPRFKYTYFLNPNDELIIGYKGLQQTIKEYSIPMTLFSNNKLKQSGSKAEGWAFITKDSFNYENDIILNELRYIREKMWVDKTSDLYMYDGSKIAVTVIYPDNNKCYLYTQEEIRKWCKNNGHSYDRFCDIRRNRLDRVGVNSTLYGYKIIKGLI